MMRLRERASLWIKSCAVSLWDRRITVKLIVDRKPLELPGLCWWSKRTAPTGIDAITCDVYSSWKVPGSPGSISTKQLCPGCGRVISVTQQMRFYAHRTAVEGVDWNSAEKWGMEPGGKRRRSVNP
jgi:hypothetical protein